MGRHLGRDLLIADHGGGGFAGQAHFLPQPVEHLMQGDPTKAEGGQQVFGAGEIAAAGHFGHRLTIEQGIEAIAAELALQHLGAALEVVFAVAGFVPVANAITGRGGSHEIEPVEAWVGRLGGNHLHEVTIPQRCGERA